VNDNQTNALICSITPQSIKVLEVLPSRMLRVTSQDKTLFGLKFFNDISLCSFLEMCQRVNLHYLDRTTPPPPQTAQTVCAKENDNTMMDYDDHALKEFFLTILQRDGFDKFITRIEGWLRCYRSKLEVLCSSQGQTEQEESTYEQDDTDQTA
jgi:hypothetical protein